MYVCVCVYIYIYTHTRRTTCICVCTSGAQRGSMHARMHMYQEELLVRTHVHVFVCIFTYVSYCRHLNWYHCQPTYAISMYIHVRMHSYSGQTHDCIKYICMSLYAYSCTCLNWYQESGASPPTYAVIELFVIGQQSPPRSVCAMMLYELCAPHQRIC
jgi:hypothetical protein